MDPIGHLKTITKHHFLVCSCCLRAGLVWQGLTHDLSKLSPTEFLVGARYYQGSRSPNNAEREERGLSTAWLHHKGRNKHHFEYWIDYTTDRDNPHGLAGCRMPRRYVAEMIFDRVSASRVYLGDKYTDDAPLAYFLRGSQKCWFIHEETKKEMEQLLRMWAEKGETYTIRYIRRIYLKEKDARKRPGPGGGSGRSAPEKRSRRRERKESEGIEKKHRFGLL